VVIGYNARVIYISRVDRLEDRLLSGMQRDLCSVDEVSAIRDQRSPGRSRLRHTGSLEAERERAAAAMSACRDALAGQGLLQGCPDPGPAEFTRALYGYLARTPAALLGVSLADAVGDRRPQNLPGTVDEYPNWRVPLCDGGGRPVLVAST